MFRLPVGVIYYKLPRVHKKNITWDRESGATKACPHLGKGPWLPWDTECFDNEMML